eukprot:13203-Pelagococcus_subviridis.AAC.1
MRSHDGDWSSSPSSAAASLLSLSSALAAGARRPPGKDARGDARDAAAIILPETASSALHGVAARAAASPNGVMAAAAATAADGALLQDVYDIVRGGRGAVVLALCDVHRIVQAAIAEDADASRAAAKTAPRRKDASLARVERKAFYLLCYANALTDDTGDVARATTGEGEGEEGEEGALELARRWLAREMREAETRRETAAAAAAAPS